MMPSVIRQIFIEHLLYAEHSSRLWGYSHERDKVPASWGSLSGGGEGETVSTQRGRPSTVRQSRCPTQLVAEGSFQRKLGLC